MSSKKILKIWKKWAIFLISGQWQIDKKMPLKTSQTKMDVKKMYTKTKLKFFSR
jgi:hypothetical protein